MRRKCRLCHRIAIDGKSYCTEHIKTSTKPRRQFDTDSFYQSKRWTEMSIRTRRERPICPLCQRAIVAVTDHIYERRWVNGKDYELDPLNLIPLCHDCHNKKTAAVRRTIINDHFPTEKTLAVLEELYGEAQDLKVVREAFSRILCY